VRSKTFPLALLSVALLMAGCASSGTASSADAVSPTAATPPPPASAALTKPEVTIPDGPPPTELVVEDLVVGNGAEAVNGAQVLVHYVGVAWSTKKEFDASWDRGQPLPFQLGTGGVIPGWDQGVLGMKVGGRRKLTIPPQLAYGPGGYPPVIGPNETLVFVVDLLAVQ
jgi:peptidylprolyl isomerase